MALTERFENDKIEIVSQYKFVQVRKAEIIEKDGVEIARSFQRHVLKCGSIDESDNFVDTDISGYSPIIQGVMNAVWTDQIKTDFKARLIANKG